MNIGLSVGSAIILGVAVAPIVTSCGQALDDAAPSSNAGKRSWRGIARRSRPNRRGRTWPCESIMRRSRRSAAAAGEADPERALQRRMFRQMF